MEAVTPVTPGPPHPRTLVSQAASSGRPQQAYARSGRLPKTKKRISAVPNNATKARPQPEQAGPRVVALLFCHEMTTLSQQGALVSVTHDVHDAATRSQAVCPILTPSSHISAEWRLRGGKGVVDSAISNTAEEKRGRLLRVVLRSVLPPSWEVSWACYPQLGTITHS
jgi:hypothetical protein